LLRRQEVRHFRELRKKVDSAKPSEYKLYDGDYAPFEVRYEAALEGLQTTIEAETKADPRSRAAALMRALRSQQLRMRTPAIKPSAISLGGDARTESTEDRRSDESGGSTSSDDTDDDSSSDSADDDSSSDGTDDDSSSDGTDDGGGNTTANEVKKSHISSDDDDDIDVEAPPWA
jgi:hypothetical protein